MCCLCVCSADSVTMWNLSHGVATLKGRVAPLAAYDESYHTTGAFRPNTDYLAVCDSYVVDVSVGGWIAACSHPLVFAGSRVLRDS